MDIVVTVPKKLWSYWLSEGDCAGDKPGSHSDGLEGEIGVDYYFTTGGGTPKIKPGERVYIVAHNRLRGYAPLVRFDVSETGAWGITLVRNGGAMAVTIPNKITGFRGWRYRWWDLKDEHPFPDWKTAEVQVRV
jgi:hypothetical protein